ncbi:MAG TPA: DUF4126 family protein [Longimicrobiaceae bacterium]|nr:DUF4126 family protein [Longimicrobiaceae bacterium]
MARRGDDSVLLTAVALGTIAGIRSMAAPALLSYGVAESGDADEFGPLERILASDATPRILALLAGGEMLADKTDFVPDRTDPVPLIGRAVVGGVTAAAFAVQRRHPVLLPALVGGASAIASTFAFFHLRRLARDHWHVPDPVLGFAEDAIVLAASKAVVDSME